jgi:hypothetical protein
MPQIAYKESEILTVTVQSPAAQAVLPVPNSQHYLGFTIQVVDAKCDLGSPAVDGGFRIEVSLDGSAWALLYSADFYSPEDPHFHQGEATTFSLRAPAKGGIRLVSKSAITTGGKILVSMYERAYPPQV